MRFPKRPLLLISLASAWLAADITPAGAQQHRATHLGNPATRFAPPLTRPDDLRARFADPKLRQDIASVLRQWGWKGNLDDLFRAAATQRITEIKVPVGTRLPFMSSRENGQATLLRDVLWAGDEPIAAYAFVFSSNGRRYRCLTPKACSNFLLIDLGSDRPNLQVTLGATTEAQRCEPFPLKILVRNAGHADLTQVLLRSPPSACIRPADGSTPLELPVGLLRAGETREVSVLVNATAGGACMVTVLAQSAEGASAVATHKIMVRTPILALECTAPTERFLNRPMEVCLTVRNIGDGPERKVNVSMPIPAGITFVSASEGGVASGGRIVWNLADLAAGSRRPLCATFTASEPAALTFSAAAQGACAQPVQTQCASRVAGVPGVLLEVVDVADPIEVGQEVIYEIRVTNQGSADLTHVRLKCTLPEVQEFVSATGSTAASVGDSGIAIEPVAVLEAKATAAWRVVVKALREATALFQVHLTTDQLPREVIESETTNQY